MPGWTLTLARRLHRLRARLCSLRGDPCALSETAVQLLGDELADDLADELSDRLAQLVSDDLLERVRRCGHGFGVYDQDNATLVRTTDECRNQSCDSSRRRTPRVTRVR
jgi:hypothetical protein